MRLRILLACILASILVNALVFGAIGTRLFPPTPRPARVMVQHKTFTPNPELAKRRVTATATPLPTVTPYATWIPLKDPRKPFGGTDE